MTVPRHAASVVLDPIRRVLDCQSVRAVESMSMCMSEAEHSTAVGMSVDTKIHKMYYEYVPNVFLIKQVMNDGQ